MQVNSAILSLHECYAKCRGANVEAGCLSILRLEGSLRGLGDMWSRNRGIDNSVSQVGAVLNNSQYRP